MLKRSKENYPPLQVGQSVLVPISHLDKGKADSNNLLATVLDADFENGLYQLGTQDGILDKRYTTGELIHLPLGTEFPFLDPKTVPSVKLSARTASTQQSASGGQGFIKCGCLSKCLTKRCSCRQAGVLCNSKCHNSHNCSNKHEDC